MNELEAAYKSLKEARSLALRVTQENARLRTELEAAKCDRGEVRVKALEWYTPSDHPQDRDEATCIAHGLGGRYTISEPQRLYMGGEGYLLWWAHDEFTFAEFRTVDEAKAAAQADFERRIRSTLETNSPPDKGEAVERAKAD